MSDKHQQNNKLNKPKIYLIAFVAFLLGNFLFEFFLEYVEDFFKISLYEAFPFTRLALLVLTIFLARKYIRDNQPEIPTKKRGKVKKVFKWSSLTILFVVIVVGILANVRGYPNVQAIESRDNSQQYLEANKINYIKCYNSLNTGKVTVSGVALSYSSYENFSKAFDIEKEFNKKIEAQCKNPVEKYEEINREYKSSSQEIAKTRVSALDKLLGNSEPEDSFSQYDSSRLIFETGGFNNLIFTEEDVRQYFEQRL